MRIYRDSEGVLQVVGLGSSGPCIFRLYKGCKGNLRVIRVPYGFKVLGIRIHAPHHMYFGFESSEVVGRYFREGFTSLGSCTATRAFSSATTVSLAAKVVTISKLDHEPVVLRQRDRAPKKHISKK